MPYTPKESRAGRLKRAEKIIAVLGETYPESDIALDYGTPFQLLVATILAAQCTDLRVNMVTPELFRHYPGPQEMAGAAPEDIEKLIFSTGFYRNKAKSLLNASAVLVQKFGGQVPGTMDELLQLPGVGRKTANVLLGHCFNTPGVVVDTHVKRISNLMGLAGSDDPDVIETQLADIIPAPQQVPFSHLLAHHGRAVCIARRPRCGQCPVEQWCPKNGAGVGE